MKNIRPLLKRVCAYMIDLFIIITISSLISSVPGLNKEMEEYQETYNEYQEKYNEYSEYLTLLEESYKDEEINEEEYTKLIESEQYQEIISSRYDDNAISKEEYKEIVVEINENFDTIAKDYIYLLNKKGVSNSIITLVCTLLYFGVVQYFLKGQTIGKRLFKLKVVSNSDKKLNILNYLFRSLVVNDVLLNSVGIIFLITTSKTVYQHANNIIGTIISLVEAIIIFLVLTREDGRGLHDLLFNTKVISVEIIKESIKQDVEITEPAEAVKEETKKKSKSTTKSKPKSKINSKKKIIDAEYKEGSK